MTSAPNTQSLSWSFETTVNEYLMESLATGPPTPWFLSSRGGFLFPKLHCIPPSNTCNYPSCLNTYERRGLFDWSHSSLIVRLINFLLSSIFLFTRMSEGVTLDGIQKSASSQGKLRFCSNIQNANPLIEPWQSPNGVNPGGNSVHQQNAPLGAGVPISPT